MEGVRFDEHGFSIRRLKLKLEVMSDSGDFFRRILVGRCSVGVESDA